MTRAVDHQGSLEYFLFTAGGKGLKHLKVVFWVDHCIHNFIPGPSQCEKITLRIVVAPEVFNCKLNEHDIVVLDSAYKYFSHM